jgi:hypothetical protein
MEAKPGDELQLAGEVTRVEEEGQKGDGEDRRAKRVWSSGIG